MQPNCRWGVGAEAPYPMNSIEIRGNEEEEEEETHTLFHSASATEDKASNGHEPTQVSSRTRLSFDEKAHRRLARSSRLRRKGAHDIGSCWGTTFRLGKGKKPIQLQGEGRASEMKGVATERLALCCLEQAKLFKKQRLRRPKLPKIRRSWRNGGIPSPPKGAYEATVARGLTPRGLRTAVPK